MTAVDEVVPGALAGERLDRLVALLINVSRAEASTLLDAGAVLLNDRQAKGSTRVAEGDRVRIDVSARPAPPSLEPVRDVPFEVAYDDEHVIVVDKPAGLVVHPGAGGETATLVHGLLARYPELAGVGTDPLRPGVVHRLDKGTSGLLIVARSPDAYETLVDMLGAHEVERRYAALVWGHPEARRGVVDAPIGRSEREPTKMTVSARGREARTGYEVEQTFVDPAEVSLLRCQLETGRTHQIRVHLAAIGHPVVGDDRYGRDRTGLTLERPFLHSAELAFEHPVTGEELRFTSPLPADLQGLLDGSR